MLHIVKTYSISWDIREKQFFIVPIYFKSTFSSVNYYSCNIYGKQGYLESKSSVHKLSNATFDKTTSPGSLLFNRSFKTSRTTTILCLDPMSFYKSKHVKPEILLIVSTPPLRPLSWHGFVKNWLFSIQLERFQRKQIFTYLIETRNINFKLIDLWGERF